MWKLYNSIVNGKKSNEMSLKENGRSITDNSEISNVMNVYFKQKVHDIKNSMVRTAKDPLEKIKAHAQNKKCNLISKLFQQERQNKP